MPVRLAFDQFPNQVLGQEVLETEIRRLTLKPPGQAAIIPGAAYIRFTNEMALRPLLILFGHRYATRFQRCNDGRIFFSRARMSSTEKSQSGLLGWATWWVCLITIGSEFPPPEK